MKALRIVIVDDEPPARRRIHRLLERTPDVSLVAECAGGREAIRTLSTGTADLVFLDVRMPDRDGFQVIEEVGPDAMPAVVFVTAHGDLALEAFRVHAVDYLLKPFDDERFAEALERARRRVREDSAASLREDLRELLAAGARGRDRRLVVRTGSSTAFLDPAEVLWIGAEGTYVRLHARERSYLQREPLRVLEERLEPARFLRIHRSHLVHLDHVREVRHREDERQVILEDGTRLAVSERYWPRLREALGI